MNERLEAYVFLAAGIGVCGFLLGIAGDLSMLGKLRGADHFAGTTDDRHAVTVMLVRTLRLRIAGCLAAIVAAVTMVAVIYRDADLIGGPGSDLDRDFEIVFGVFASIILLAGIACAVVAWRDLRARKRLLESRGGT